MAADPSVDILNYHQQGGAEWDIGGVLNILPGGSIQDNGVSRPAKITITPAAGTTGICLVTIQVQDNAGNNLTAPFALDVWLSDAATGAGLTATSASGAVAAGASGADFGDYTTKKAKRVQTSTAGTYILSITDTAKTGFYVCVSTPGSGRPTVGAQLVTANYG